MVRKRSDGPLGLSRAGTAVVRAGLVAWSLVGITLVLYGLLQVAAFLRIVLIAVGLAFIIVLFLEPVVSRLARLRVPRVLATAIVYVAVLGPVTLGVWWLGGILVRQISDLVEAAPDLMEQAGTVAAEVWGRLAGLGIPMPAESPEMWLEDNREQIIEWALDLATAATRWAGILVASLAGPVMAFFTLSEFPRLKRAVVRRIPRDRREDLVEGLGIVTGTVGAFFRGQMLIALSVGVASTIGLLLLGVPYAVLVGTIAGVSDLIPFFGPIVGAVPGIVIAFIDGGIWLAVAVVVLFVVIQQLESHVLSPLILGKSVHLRPVVVMVAMMAGAVAAGVLGMILVIPMLASAKALWQHFGPEPEEDEVSREVGTDEERASEEPDEEDGAS